jgi:hypothetical protein
VIPHLLSFGGERTVERQLPTNHDRVASAWIGEKAMIGAESLRLTGELPGILPNLDSPQYHPVTLHWQMPDGDVGWMRLRHWGPVEARAEEGRLTIHAPLLPMILERYGDVHRSSTFEIYCGKCDGASITAERWDLPGLRVDLQSNLPTPEFISDDGKIHVVYSQSDNYSRATFELSVVPHHT